MPKPRSRATLEAGLRLDINQLIRSGLKTREFTVRMGGQDGSASAHLVSGNMSWICLRCPPAPDLTVRLVDLPRYFGGRQWYFLCPITSRRASVLWRPRGASYFACQKHWRRRAGYSSQFLTACDRAHRNIHRIEARLVYSETDNMLYKPKWMRWAIFDRLCERLDEQEDILNERLVRVAARLMRRC